MTDTQIQALKKGDVVHDETALGCIAYTVTTDPAPCRARTYYEVWARSRTGVVVVCVNYHSGQWHRAKDCELHPAPKVKAKAKARR